MRYLVFTRSGPGVLEVAPSLARAPEFRLRAVSREPQRLRGELGAPPGPDRLFRRRVVLLTPEQAAPWALWCRPGEDEDGFRVVDVFVEVPR